MTLHRIRYLYTEWFSVCLNITSKFHSIATFNRFIKQNKYLNKTCRHVRDLLQYQTSFV
jgi:hypothetical protein